MCNEKQTSRKGVAWLTVVVNDAYAVPVLVLGDSIRRFSCHKKLIMLISKDVTQQTRKALKKVGWSIHEVESMDCDWLACLYTAGSAGRTRAIWHGTTLNIQRKFM